MRPPRLRAIISRRVTCSHASPRRGVATIVPLKDLAFAKWEPESSKGKSDQQDAPIVFMHGLFGSKQNNRSMSKALARDLNRTVYAIDLRNHGASPHSPVHDYDHLTADVLEFIKTHQLHRPTLIGHSMGAKTAMCVALQSPSTIANLIAVDNAPVDAALKSDFGSYVKGMKEVERKGVSKTSEADKILEPYAKVYEPWFAPSELAVRQFLLTNLARSKEDPKKLEWRIPLAWLTNNLDNMGAFPFTDPDKTRFEGPTLIVRGTKSHYVPDETLPVIGRFFPRFELADVDSGHWVISENPNEFKRVVVQFMEEKE